MVFSTLVLVTSYSRCHLRDRQEENRKSSYNRGLPNAPLNPPPSMVQLFLFPFQDAAVAGGTPELEKMSPGQFTFPATGLMLSGLRVVVAVVVIVNDGGV